MVWYLRLFFSFSPQRNYWCRDLHSNISLQNKIPYFVARRRLFICSFSFPCSSFSHFLFHHVPPLHDIIFLLLLLHPFIHPLSVNSHIENYPYCLECLWGCRFCTYSSLAVIISNPSTIAAADAANAAAA